MQVQELKNDRFDVVIGMAHIAVSRAELVKLLNDMERLLGSGERIGIKEARVRLHGEHGDRA